MTPIIRGTGAIPSPADSRDFLFSATPEFVEVTADTTIDFGNVRMPVVGPVLDQGNLPQCVAYMAAGGKALDEFLQLGHWPKYDTAEAYRNAQAIDGIPTPHDGTTVRAMLQVMQQRGLRDTVTGHRYLIGSYHNLMADPDPIRSVGVAISLHRRVYLAFAFCSAWFGDESADGTWPSGYLPEVHGSEDSGHAVWCWGVRTATADYTARTDNGGTVSVKKGERVLRTRWAWGAQAGNGFGNVDIPESLFDKIGHDLWSTVDR